MNMSYFNRQSEKEMDGFIIRSSKNCLGKIEQNKTINSLTVVHYTCTESPGRKKMELAPYKGCSLNNLLIFREEWDTVCKFKKAKKEIKGIKYLN